MLSVANKPFMQSVIMLSVTNKPFTLSVIILSVIMLSVIMQSVIMLNVMAPDTCLSRGQAFLEVTFGVDDWNEAPCHSVNLLSHLPTKSKVRWDYWSQIGRQGTLAAGEGSVQLTS